MRKSLFAILSLIVLSVGLGLGEMAWTRLNVSTCREWQGELQRRVEAYARMHLPDPAPQVQVQSTCGHSFVADALYFRWHKLLWRMGWRDSKPLEEADLRLAATRDLMQHPAMGPLKFVVRFDAALNRDIQKRVEALLSRYLTVEAPRQKLEFRRVKKLPETPAAQGSVLALEPSSRVGLFNRLLFSVSELPIPTSLIKAGNGVMALILAIAAGMLLVQFLGQILRLRRKAAVIPSATPDRRVYSILVAPRVIFDFSERAREVWRLLWQLDRERARQRVLHSWQKDREGLLHFLSWLDSESQESMLSFLTTDQLLQLDPAPPGIEPRDAQRAALRVLLDLARDLGQCCPLATAPLFIHLMTRRDWLRVAQQLSRPRRRALAEMLDSERAGWLRSGQDLHPGWFQSGNKEMMTAEQLMRRVRSTLQVDADQLREQLSSDRDALQVVDDYFADLTLDSSLNSDLMMLVLAACQQRQVGFGRLIERRDHNLFTALQTCADQQLALLLFECDSTVKNQALIALGERAAKITMLLRGMEQDRQHGKSLRMQSRSLQRFMEQQVLVADLLCATIEST